MTTSSALLTDIASAISTGPSAASLAAAVNPTGPQMDLLGMLVLAQTKMKETRVLFDNIHAVIDGSDGIKTTLDNIRSTFV